MPGRLPQPGLDRVRPGLGEHLVQLAAAPTRRRGWPRPAGAGPTRRWCAPRTTGRAGAPPAAGSAPWSARRRATGPAARSPRPGRSASSAGGRRPGAAGRSPGAARAARPPARPAAGRTPRARRPVPARRRTAGDRSGTRSSSSSGAGLPAVPGQHLRARRRRPGPAGPRRRPRRPSRRAGPAGRRRTRAAGRRRTGPGRSASARSSRRRSGGAVGPAGAGGAAPAAVGVRARRRSRAVQPEPDALAGGQVVVPQRLAKWSTSSRPRPRSATSAMSVLSLRGPTVSSLDRSGGEVGDGHGQPGPVGHDLDVQFGAGVLDGVGGQLGGEQQRLVEQFVEAGLARAPSGPARGRRPGYAGRRAAVPAGRARPPSLPHARSP